jgi:hypothetical protein
MAVTPEALERTHKHSEELGCTWARLEALGGARKHSKALESNRIRAEISFGHSETYRSNRKISSPLQRNSARSPSLWVSNLKLVLQLFWVNKSNVFHVLFLFCKIQLRIFDLLGNESQRRAQRTHASPYLCL